MNCKAGLLAGCAVLVTACSGSEDDNVVNQPPTIGEIAAVSTTANQTSDPIAFQIRDENVNGLVVSAMSDRPDVIPDEAIEIRGSGANREIVVTPIVDVVGDAQITLIAEDIEGLVAGASFLVTVTAEQKSMQQFARSTFAFEADEEPELINAVEFAQDADDDDFADLLTP